MTYAELLAILNGMTKDQLNQDVTIRAVNGEFYPSSGLEIQNGDGILDDGHFYIKADDFSD